MISRESFLYLCVIFPVVTGQLTNITTNDTQAGVSEGLGWPDRLMSITRSIEHSSAQLAQRLNAIIDSGQIYSDCPPTRPTLTSGFLWTSPNFGQSLHDLRSCKVRLQAPRNKRIMIYVIYFKIFGEPDSNSGSCRQDRLEFFDSSTYYFSLMARYCGQSANSGYYLYTTQRYSNARYYRRRGSEGSEWAVAFDIVDSIPPEQCDVVRDIDSGDLGFILYPQQVINSLEFVCEWHFTAPTGQRVHLAFLSIEVDEQEDICTGNALTLYDVMGDIPQERVSICDMSVLGDLYSISNEFHLAVSLSVPTSPTIHFSVVYRFFEGQSEHACGLERPLVDTAPMHIHFPSLTDHYENSMDCSWTIIGQSEMYLELALAGHIEDGTGPDVCDHDVLSVINAESGEVQRFCGSLYDPEVIIPASSVNVTFTSDLSNVSVGFDIVVRAVSPYAPHLEACGENQPRVASLSDYSSIVIDYPGMGLLYPSNQQCSWRVDVEEGRHILLDFEMLSIEDDPSCRNDTLEIIVDDILEHELCGFELPGDIRVATNSVTLVFGSDSDVEDNGFTIRAASVEPLTDDETTTEGLTTDDITDQTDPESGADVSLHSTTDITDIADTTNTSPSTIASSDPEVDDTSTTERITTEDMTDQTDPESGADVSLSSTTEISDIADTTNTEGVSTSPSTIASSDQEAVDPCGPDQPRVFTEPQGYIDFPEGPGFYDNNMQCSWKILIPLGSVLGMNFNYVNIERSRDCVWDRLTIRNVTTLCGSGQWAMPETSWTARDCLLTFISDGFVRKRGFEMQYWFSEFTAPLPPITTGVDPCVDGPLILESEQGTIDFYNSHTSYENNQNCQWQINVAAGKHISIEFERFEIERHRRCVYDYLEFHWKAFNKKMCKANANTILVLNDNIVDVEFSSDYSVTSRGFLLHWTTVDPITNYSCGSPEIGHLGRIVGGQAATPHSHPWIVGLLRQGSSPYCAGSLIRPQWVVTASHCIGNDVSSLSVAAGMHGIGDRISDGVVVRRVALAITHEGYSDQTIDNDIALLYLAEAIPQSEYIQPVCLDDTPPSAGTRCWIAGWGDTTGENDYPQHLREGEVEIIDRGTCRGWGMDITSNMVCAGYENGGIDSCQGDSGGPLVCQTTASAADDDESISRWVLKGITSWGYGCAGRESPGVYTLVANYQSWIRSKIES